MPKPKRHDPPPIGIQSSLPFTLLRPTRRWTVKSNAGESRLSTSPWRQHRRHRPKARTLRHSKPPMGRQQRRLFRKVQNGCSAFAQTQALAKKGRDSDPGRRPGRKGRHPMAGHMAGHMAELGPHLRDYRRRCSNRARQAEVRLKRLVKHGVPAASARNLQMVIVEGALPIIQKIRNLCIHVKNT